MYNMLKLQECEIDANERPLFPSKILKTEVKLIPVKKSVLPLKKSFFVLKYFLLDWLLGNVFDKPYST